jgi:NhaP-type Na+/H+ or K+/H+ antiporter
MTEDRIVHGAFLDPVVLIVVGASIGLALGVVVFILLPWAWRRVRDARVGETAVRPSSSPEGPWAA